MSFGTSPIATGHDYSNGQPPAPQPKKSNRRRNILAALATLGVLFLGMAIGSAGKPAPVTIEKQIPGPERVVTKEVKVPTTPQSCLTALDLNEQAFGYASDAMGAITSGRFSGADTATAKIKALTPRATQAKADCRAGKS